MYPAVNIYLCSKVEQLQMRASAFKSCWLSHRVIHHYNCWNCMGHEKVDTEPCFRRYSISYYLLTHFQMLISSKENGTMYNGYIVGAYIFLTNPYTVVMVLKLRL